MPTANGEDYTIVEAFEQTLEDVRNQCRAPDFVWDEIITQILGDLREVRRLIYNVSLCSIVSSGFGLRVETCRGQMPTLWVRCLFDDDAWYLIDGMGDDYWEVMGNDSLPEVYRRQLRA